MKKIVVFALLLCVPLAFWGWAYEFSYFQVLTGSLPENFTFLHYVLSATEDLVFMVLTLIILANFLKFFSKNINRDDWQEVKSTLAKLEFKTEVTQARAGFFGCLLFWSYVFFANRVGWSTDIGHQSRLLMFVVSQLFLASIALAPTHAKLSVIVPFVISLSLCFSAGGIASANAAKLATGVVRNDLVTTVVMIDMKASVVVKTVQLPFSLSPRGVLAWLTS